MYRISIWSGILLTVYMTIGSCVEVRLQKREADIYAKCLPALLEDVQHVAAAVQITIIPPRFSPPEECVLKGKYMYMVSYAEGKGPRLWKMLQNIGEPIVLIHLKHSTAYTITVAMGYFYTSTGHAEETPEFLIKTKTTDIAVPPPPTAEIKLVDSSLLNKTQQRYEFPSDIFSDANGNINEIRMLVAQDTEIDKCDHPVTWKAAHSHSPIKCYNAGSREDLTPGCQSIARTRACVLGFQEPEECDDDMCNGPLTPGVKYGFKLRAINQAGSTDSKPVFFTAGNPPGAAGSGSGAGSKDSVTTASSFIITITPTTITPTTITPTTTTTKGSDVGGKGSGRMTSGSSSLIGAITFFVILAMTK